MIQQNSSMTNLQSFPIETFNEPPSMNLSIDEIHLKQEDQSIVPRTGDEIFQEKISDAMATLNDSIQPEINALDTQESKIPIANHFILKNELEATTSLPLLVDSMDISHQIPREKTLPKQALNSNALVIYSQANPFALTLESIKSKTTPTSTALETEAKPDSIAVKPTNESIESNESKAELVHASDTQSMAFSSPGVVPVHHSVPTTAPTPAPTAAPTVVPMTASASVPVAVPIDATPSLSLASQQLPSMTSIQPNQMINYPFNVPTQHFNPSNPTNQMHSSFVQPNPLNFNTANLLYNQAGFSPQQNPLMYPTNGNLANATAFMAPQNLNFVQAMPGNPLASPHVNGPTAFSPTILGMNSMVPNFITPAMVQAFNYTMPESQTLVNNQTSSWVQPQQQHAIPLLTDLPSTQKTASFFQVDPMTLAKVTQSTQSASTFAPSAMVQSNAPNHQHEKVLTNALETEKSPSNEKLTNLETKPQDSTPIKFKRRRSTHDSRDDSRSTDSESVGSTSHAKTGNEQPNEQANETKKKSNAWNAQVSKQEQPKPASPSKPSQDSQDHHNDILNENSSSVLFALDDSFTQESEKLKKSQTSDKTKSRRRRARTQSDQDLTSLSHHMSELDPTTDKLTAYSSSPVPGMRKFGSNSTVNARHLEKDRLACIHQLGILENLDHSRLGRITQLTHRLLSGTVAVLSIVDLDRTIWLSSYWSSKAKNSMKEEPRYESFCSWVVHDETSRGIIVMDGRTDPRCTHMRIKSGLEFYAGAPLISSTGVKIGALSVRGPPRSQFSIMDMNLLHEMSSWAMGEIEMLAQARELDLREQMQVIRAKLGKLIENDDDIQKGLGNSVIENALKLVLEGLRASNVIFFKIVPDQDRCRSIVHSIASSLASPCSLNPSEEAFNELANQVLKKEGQTLVTDPFSATMQAEVDKHLNKNIFRCASELVWNSSQPAGYLDQQFLSTSADALSTVLGKMERLEVYKQSQMFSKVLLMNLKKNSVALGRIQGLAPCVLIVEPIFNSNLQHINTALQFGAKGETQAKLISDLQAIEGVVGTERGKDLLASALDTTKNSSITLTPNDIMGIVSDFSQMLEVLADRYNIKRAKRFGNLAILMANTGPDSGTPENLAHFAHELFFTLDIYRQKTRRNFSARVGIHAEYIPIEMADEVSLRDIWSSIVNICHQLENLAESVLVSDTFHSLTREKCTFETLNPIFIRGYGTVMTYRLIGMSTMDPQPEQVVIKPLTETSPKLTNGMQSGEVQVKSKRKKCTIL